MQQTGRIDFGTDLTRLGQPKNAPAVTTYYSLSQPPQKRGFGGSEEGDEEQREPQQAHVLQGEALLGSGILVTCYMIY